MRTSKFAINQLLPTISYGDAVSNSAVNMMNTLRSMGIMSNIYAENIHSKMSKLAYKWTKIPRDQPVIYHLSTGSELASRIPEFTNTKIVYYHNITPPNFFAGYSGLSQRLCREGREQLGILADCFDFSLAASDYNKKELDELGYKNTETIPLIINFEDYGKHPNQRLMNQLRADPEVVNILFVGRIAPNKKQDDVIKVFYYYKKFINPKAKLHLVGNFQGMERYYMELVQLVKDLDLSDVNITGHLPFNQILSYYKAADLFLCMSEHEGFCVPIVEAMYFGLPIIAYKSSAIPLTLGNGGFTVDKKDYIGIAELIHYVIKNKELRCKLSNNQKKRLADLSKENVTQILKNWVVDKFPV